MGQKSVVKFRWSCDNCFLLEEIMHGEAWQIIYLQVIQTSTSRRKKWVTIITERNLNVIYRFSSISRSTKAVFKFLKLRSLFEIGQNIFSVHHFDIGRVQAAMGSCLQFCVVQQRNDRVLIHFHINCTTWNCYRGKLQPNITRKLNFDDLCLCFWQ